MVRVHRRVSLVRPLLAGAGLLVLFATFAVPAGAQAPPGTTYKAAAQATGLDLKAFGQGITLGLSQTDVVSDPKADATGIGLVLPGAGNQNAMSATSGSEGQTAGTPAPGTCGPLTLPDSVPMIDLSTACTSALTSITSGLPDSMSTAQVADIKVNPADVLSQIPLSDILDQAQLDQLNAVLSQLDASGVNAQDLVTKLLDALQSATELVHVELGPTQAASKALTDPANTVQGVATAQGTIIDLLPRAEPLGPVAKIEVGASSNTITVDQTTGAATVNFEPSLVKITLADDIVAALPAPPDGTPITNPITVAPGQSQCLPLPDPLVSCITVAGGSQSQAPDGTTHADAAAVSLDLLKGLPGGGVSLSLAKTSVEAVAVAPAAPAAPPAEALPRTGGSTNNLLVAGLLAFAVLGSVLTRAARRTESVELR